MDHPTSSRPTVSAGSAARWLRLRPARLAVAPRVEVPRCEGEEAELQVHGLVCGICAARTEAALRATPGVQEARVDLDRGTAVVRLAPDLAHTPADRQALQEAMQRSLEGVVVGMRFRRSLEQIARSLGAAVRMGLGRITRSRGQ